MSNNKKKALFICLGNICRSPIAEGVFQKTVNEMGLGDEWDIDSAAIGGWHVGNPPDTRALDTMKKHNVPYSNHARQIITEDFQQYDYIFGMDESNMKDLSKRAPKGCKAKLLLFGDFDPKGERIIRDPYYKGKTFARSHPNAGQVFLFCSNHFLGRKFVRQFHPLLDSDSKGFEKCYQQSLRCSKGFLEHVQKENESV